MPNSTNLPHCRMNLLNILSWKRQVYDLMRREFIKSLCSCAFPTLVIPERMVGGECVHSQAINKTTIKYRFPISRLDEILDIWYNLNCFNRLFWEMAIIRSAIEKVMRGKSTLKLKMILMKVRDASCLNKAVLLWGLWLGVRSFYRSFLVIYFDEYTFTVKPRKTTFLICIKFWGF